MFYWNEWPETQSSSDMNDIFQAVALFFFSLFFFNSFPLQVKTGKEDISLSLPWLGEAGQAEAAGEERGRDRPGVARKGEKKRKKEGEGTRSITKT